MGDDKFEENDDMDLKEEKYALPKSVRDNIDMIKRAVTPYQSVFSTQSVEGIQDSLGLADKIMTPKDVVKGFDIISPVTKRLSVDLGMTSKAIMSSSFSDMAATLGSLPKLYTPVNVPALAASMSQWRISPAWAETLATIQRNYSSLWSAFESPVIKWMHSFPISPAWVRIQVLANYKIDPQKLRKIYLQEMYDAHWFPDSFWKADIELKRDIAAIIEHTREGSKSRTQKIDKAVFRYYTDKAVEQMKKDWRSLDLPEYLMRILHQCVQAYRRKEYALTVIVLATQWEGIICEKVKDFTWKKNSKTKKNYHMLVDDNDYPEIFKSYYDDFIIYDCHTPQDTIQDVPGRNSAAHSFFERYPRKKAALNAILFTDFLLNLKPLGDEA